eukprot:m.230959 g.230959  ORF g.230959 m.230959 type:complete len:892 (-) comp33591_c2_seq1:1647-4322(-)
MLRIALERQPLGLVVGRHVHRTRVQSQKLLTRQLHCHGSFRSGTLTLNQAKPYHVQSPFMTVHRSTNSLFGGHSRRSFQTTNNLLKWTKRSQKKKNKAPNEHTEKSPKKGAKQKAGRNQKNGRHLQKLLEAVGNSRGLITMKKSAIAASKEVEVRLSFLPIEDPDHKWINAFIPKDGIVGRSNSGRLHTTASDDAYSKLTQLQDHVIKQSKATFPPAYVSKKEANLVKWNADHRNRFLDYNDALKLKTTSSYVPSLQLFATTATLQLPKTNSEDVQKYVRMFGTDSISFTMYGRTKKWLEREAMNGICAQLILASGQGVAARAHFPGFSVAEVLKEEVEKAQIFLEYAVMEPIEISIKNAKKNRFVGFGQLSAERVGVNSPITFEGREVGMNQVTAKNHAIIEANRLLQESLPENYKSLISIHEDAFSKNRRILPMKVPGVYLGQENVGKFRSSFGSRRQVCDRLEMLEEDSVVHVHQAQNNNYQRRRREPYNFDETLHTELQSRRERIPDMMAARDRLPIVALKDQMIEALKSNQVVVISGGTGSGKSTQIPQYILDEAIAGKQGSKCNIIVTQPRRIAATSVAQRVAHERGERIGESTGYRVRLMSSRPRDHGSIEFCTTGVMLRQLQADPLLTNISHVLVDEVHERDINTDFLLLLLKDVLKARPDDFKLILMSATLDAAAFSDYYGGVPLVEVPSVTRHPVEEFYLEDLLDEKGFTQRDVLDILSWERESIASDKAALQLDSGSHHDVSNSSDSTSTAYVDPHLAQLGNAGVEHEALCTKIANGPVTFRNQKRDQQQVYQLTAKVINHIVSESSVEKPLPSKSYPLPSKKKSSSVPKSVSFEELLAAANAPPAVAVDNGAVEDDADVDVNDDDDDKKMINIHKDFKL